MSKSEADNRHNNRPVDTKLRELNDDPRDDPRAPLGKAQKAAMGVKGLQGMNTQSFDPASTIVRPTMRIKVASKHDKIYPHLMKADDVIIVPEFFCDQDDWSLYYSLVEELREAQQDGAKGSEWLSWHEGAHLIVKKPDPSPTVS